jgi:hypothetical protein
VCVDSYLPLVTLRINLFSSYLPISLSPLSPISRGKLIFIPRTAGISTTELLRCIQVEYGLDGQNKNTKSPNSPLSKPSAKEGKEHDKEDEKNDAVTDDA